MRRWPVLLLLPLALGCTDPSERLADQLFNQSLALWQSSKPANYTFELELSCFCPADATGDPVVMVVQNGSVVSRTYTSNGTAVPAQLEAEFPGIDALFAMIQTARSQGWYEVQAAYDGTYGFPTDVGLNQTPGATSDDRVYAVRQFTPQ